jgi:class 3 adenylate cyclase
VTGESTLPLAPSRELEAVKRFPEGNPNPVLQMTPEGRLLYANPASAPILAALGVDVGDALPARLVGELRDALRLPAPPPVQLRAAERTFSVLPVAAPELGVVNLYATDVTAARVLERFPDWNPNPVMRLDRDGTLLYANAASAPIVEVLGARAGERLPAYVTAQLLRALHEQAPEPFAIQCGGHHYALHPRLVPELGTINVYGTDVTAARAVELANRENERLLLAILPPSVAERLRSGETSIADSFEEMTVLFADLVGFTELSSRLTAVEVVRVLNQVFSLYDELADRHGLEKIKTIGDAYMAVGGVAPDPNGRDHAEAVAETALEMVQGTERLAAEAGYDLAVRVGVHVGPTVAGVIGMRKFIYDVWGDAVNKASRMESSGVPGRVQVTEDTYRRLRGAFAFERRGEIDVKGLGRVTTYLLVEKLGT